MPTPEADARLVLKELSAALTDLHRALLRSAQREYEQSNGPVAPGKLLQLVAYDQRFAWLRCVSEVIVEIDERIRDPDPIPAYAAAAIRGAVEERLSSQEGEFLERLRAALQSSPEAAMSVGAVRMALHLLPAPEPAAAPGAPTP